MPFARRSIGDPTGGRMADCASPEAAPTMEAMRRLLLSCVLATAVLVVWSGVSRAGTSAATPVFHGKLDMTPAGGRIARRAGGVATVKVNLWRFEPDSTTNGISPSTERVVIALGEGNWALEPGMLVESKKGGIWRYRAKGKPGPRAITMLRVKLETDGSYSFRFRITGADMSQLNTEDPVCEPFAFIIGDDDGFDGVLLTSPSFVSSKLRIFDRCVPGGWPWA